VGICPAASLVRVWPVNVCWSEAGVPDKPGAGITNRPPGDLNRMPAATCRSIGSASSDAGTGYSTTTPPDGMTLTWADEK
jgi:hypothetical protein